jgi:hypothetical protein
MARRLLRPGAAPAPPWRDKDADEGYGATATPDWRETDWSRSRCIYGDGLLTPGDRLRCEAHAAQVAGAAREATAA